MTKISAPSSRHRPMQHIGLNQSALQRAMYRLRLGRLPFGISNRNSVVAPSHETQPCIKGPAGHRAGRDGRGPGGMDMGIGHSHDEPPRHAQCFCGAAGCLGRGCVRLPPPSLSRETASHPALADELCGPDGRREDADQTRRVCLLAPKPSVRNRCTADRGQTGLGPRGLRHLRGDFEAAGNQWLEARGKRVKKG